MLWANQLCLCVCVFDFYFVKLTPYRNFIHENSKPIYLQATLVHDNAPSSKIWLENGSAFMIYTHILRNRVTDKVIPTYLNSPTQTLLPWQAGRGLIKFHIWERTTGTQELSYKRELISGQQTQVHMYHLKLMNWIHHYIMASLSFISPAPLYFFFLHLKPHNKTVNIQG